MALSNAERQAKWRAKRDAEAKRAIKLEADVERLRKKLNVRSPEAAKPTKPAAPPRAESQEPAIYYGMNLWPKEVPTWRNPNDPTIPTKTDLDNTYWFVEELARALRANGVSHRAAARYIRNWSKYIGALQKPAAAASIMQDMAQGLDTRGDDEACERQNRMPGHPTKFAKGS